MLQNSQRSWLWLWDYKTQHNSFGKCDAFSCVFTLETCVFTCTVFHHWKLNEWTYTSLCLLVSLSVLYIHIYYLYVCDCVNADEFSSLAVFFGLHFICFPSSNRRTEVRRRISSYHPDGIKYMKCSHFWYTQHIEKGRCTVYTCTKMYKSRKRKSNGNSNNSKIITRQ